MTSAADESACLRTLLQVNASGTKVHHKDPEGSQATNAVTPKDNESEQDSDPDSGKVSKPPQCTLFGGPFAGWDKYLGGTLGDDGAIYGVPGSAKYVMRILREESDDTKSNTGDGSGQILDSADLLLGAPLKGPYVQTSYPANQFKWLRGAKSPLSGDIFGIPANADSVLRVRTGPVIAGGAALAALGGSVAEETVGSVGSANLRRTKTTTCYEEEAESKEVQKQKLKQRKRRNSASLMELSLSASADARKASTASPNPPSPKVNPQATLSKNQQRKLKKRQEKEQKEAEKAKNENPSVPTCKSGDVLTFRRSLQDPAQNAAQNPSSSALTRSTSTPADGCGEANKSKASIQRSVTISEYESPGSSSDATDAPYSSSDATDGTVTSSVSARTREKKKRMIPWVRKSNRNLGIPVAKPFAPKVQFAESESCYSPVTRTVTRNLEDEKSVEYDSPNPGSSSDYDSATITFPGCSSDSTSVPLGKEDKKRKLKEKKKMIPWVRKSSRALGIPVASPKMKPSQPPFASAEQYPQISIFGDAEKFPMLKGSWKWHGGVLALDNHIYGIPCNAGYVIKIDGETSKISMLRNEVDSNEKAQEPQIQDGNANDATDSLESTFGPALTGNRKWYGGLLAPDGCIYGIPNCSNRVLQINPKTGIARKVGPDLGSEGYKWHGGVVGKDGTIYGVPSHETSVLKIAFEKAGESGSQSDSLIPVITRIGQIEHARPSDGHSKYKYGGAVVGEDGKMYCIPSDADRVLRVTPGWVLKNMKQRGAQLEQFEELLLKEGKELPDRVECIGPRFVCQNKWQNGFSGRDGCVYCIPCDYHEILRIVCCTGEVQTMEIPEGRGGVGGINGDKCYKSTDGELAVEGLKETAEQSDVTAERKQKALSDWRFKREKWEGGEVGLDGAMYCFPQQADCVLRIDPGHGDTV